MFSHLWIFASDVFFLCPSIHFQEEYIYSRRVLGRDYFLNNVCTWEGLFVTFITNDNMVFPLGFSAAAAAKSLQSCPTPCDPVDGSPLGFPVPGILQARTLELVAISFSNAWKWKVKVKSLSHVQLLATPWTAAHQAPQPMGFSRQEYWSGVPLPSPFYDLDTLILW